MQTLGLELQEEFIGKDDEFWGVEFDDDGASNFSGHAFSGVSCTGFAIRVLEKLGSNRVRIYGFLSTDNPNAGVNSLSGGHDFAVVDNRYIVDPWLSEVESGRITTVTGKTLELNGQVVFDIVEDAALVKSIYGHIFCWNRMRGAEKEADTARGESK